MIIFDLEQEIMSCWQVIDDIERLTNAIGDRPEWQGIPPELEDKLMNQLFGIKSVYEMRFEQLWSTFEKHTAEYHRFRRISEEEM